MKITIKKSFQVVALNGFVLWTFGYSTDRNRAYNKALKAMAALYNSGKIKAVRLVDMIQTSTKKEGKPATHTEAREYVGALGCKIEYGSSPRKITINESLSRKMRDKAERTVSGIPEVFTEEENNLLSNFNLD